jgi:hypothetical protein
MVAGFFVVGSLIVGYQNLKALQDGQLTERFTKAVEQLGNPDSSVRLGGIFSLERIARESERDYVAVVEILCAYARGHSRDPKHREEIKATMLVIGRRKVEWDENSGSRSWNLANLDLRNMDLRGGNYADVSFTATQFSEAKLAKCRFDNADLSDCSFDQADLTKAVLNNANLRRTSFSNATLFGAKLRRADLSGAKLLSASLWASDLTESNFTGATLIDSSLLDATVKRANFQGADLTDTVVLPGQLDSTLGTPAKSPSSVVLKIRKTPEGQVSILHHVGRLPIGAESPVRAGEFLEVFCDGVGDLRWPDETEIPYLPRTVKPPRASIDGKEVSVTYSGVAPASPASYQINLHVPPDLLPGTHSLKITVDNDAPLVLEIISAPAT